MLQSQSGARKGSTYQFHSCHFYRDGALSMDTIYELRSSEIRDMPTACACSSSVKYSHRTNRLRGYGLLRTFKRATLYNTTHCSRHKLFPSAGEVTLISKQINHHTTNTTSRNINAKLYVFLQL